MRQLSPDMRKTSSYGVQREGAIVLLAAKPLLSSCKQNLAILSDGRSRIMGSVVNSKCQHFLGPHATSKIVIGRFQRSHYCAVRNRGEASIVLEPLEDIGSRITTVYLRLEIAARKLISRTLTVSAQVRIFVGCHNDGAVDRKVWGEESAPAAASML